MSRQPLFLGMDVGTQGARVVVTTAEGVEIAAARRAFATLTLPGLPEGHLEQDPAGWWEALRDALGECLQQVRDEGGDPSAIVAGAIDSTSGTIVLLDADNRPLRPAVLYNDRRAGAEAEEINSLVADFCDAAGYRFNSSFALPRLLWLSRHEKEVWVRTRRVLHAADYLLGCLTGIWDCTDQTNALKTGFDLRAGQWPRWIESDLDIDLDLLPRVEMSGTVVGTVTPASAAATGLSTGTQLTTGMTDGCADQVASGAHRPGDWNTVIGTTLVLKGLSQELLRDPEGRVYCHRHPMGFWMPGGAGNVGAQVLDEKFGADHGPRLAEAALALSPTALTVYPLQQRGERFPFVHATAQGFEEGTGATQAERYAAYLEGVACTERLAYEVVRSLGAEIGSAIYTTGGGARSDQWLQIRADVLGRELVRGPGSAALGMAAVAASTTWFSDLAAATRQMVRPEFSVSPRPGMQERYDEVYGRFVEALRQRGYIQ